MGGEGVQRLSLPRPSPLCNVLVVWQGSADTQDTLRSVSRDWDNGTGGSLHSEATPKNFYFPKFLGKKANGLEERGVKGCG